jgi:flagellar hook-length control protein FliK
MKIDTTPTILQLSSVLAASAGVAAPSQVAGTDSGPPAAIATAPAAPNQKPLSFQQMLAQIQQAASEASQPSSTPTASDELATAPAPPAKDADSDPTSISTALMALLSQSNRPVPANVPANAVVPSTEVKPTDAVGTAAAQTGGATPTLAVGCPAAIETGSVPQSTPAVPPSDGKMQPIAIKNPTPPTTGDLPQTTPATPSAVADESKPEVKQSDLPMVAAGAQTDRPPAITVPAQAVKVPDTTSTPAPATINSSPIADPKAVDSKTADIRIQPADASASTQPTKESPPEVVPDKISGTAARHTRNETFRTATSAAANEGHVVFSNLTNLIGDAAVETSSDAVKPVKEISDNARSKETSETTAIDQGMPGESANGITDTVTALDPAPQGAAVDAHSLAHHLESMVMQRLDQPESKDKSSVVLRLDPPELGRVNVHLSVANDVVSIRMVTTDDAARQVIERQLSQLQQSLSDKGISFQDFQVQTGGSQQQRSSHQGFAKHWADNSGYLVFGGRRASAAVSTPQVRNGILGQLDYVA